MKHETLYLPPLWLERWKSPNPFWHALHLQGEVYREQPGRKTLRFIEDGEPYFIKCHYGVGWKEIFKNLLQGRLPVLGAADEYRALQSLAHFGFVPKVVGYGSRGKNPAQKQSFLITKALSYTISLEDYCQSWHQQQPNPRIKHALIRKVASLAKTIHDNGINHRDFYLCHLLLDITGGRELLSAPHLSLFLIDLHRAQIRRSVPFRWRVKDIAGLYFSAMNIGLTTRDLKRFRQAYNGEKNPLFWYAVHKQAIKLYQKILRKLSAETPLPFYFTLENRQVLRGLKILRCLPRKRMVVKGEWQGKTVLAKIFVQKKHALRELQGYQHLQKEQCLTPHLLFHGWVQHHALYLLLFEYKTEAQTFFDVFSQASAHEKKWWLRQLTALIQSLHQVGISHKDLHFDNFLVENNLIYMIDLASVRSQKKPLSDQQSEAHLAQILAQLPYDYRHLAEDYLTPSLREALIKAKAKREQKYLAKVQRNCTAYRYQKSCKKVLIIDRDFDKPEMWQAINANTLEQHLSGHFSMDGQTFQINFFQPSRWQDYFRSPARHAWLSLHKAKLTQRSCPTPIALIEKRWLFFTLASYLVTKT